MYDKHLHTGYLVDVANVTAAVRIIALTLNRTYGFMRILIADDHAIVRRSIRALLKAQPKWEVCGEAVNGQDVVRLARELRPDIIIMDISMPVMSGLQATEQLTKEGYGIRILILTVLESQSLPEAIRRAGASGYVDKFRAARDLIDALEHLRAGGTFFGEPQSLWQPYPSDRRPE